MGIVDPSYAVVFYDLSSIISRKFTLIGFFFRYEDGVFHWYSSRNIKSPESGEKMTDQDCLFKNIFQFTIYNHFSYMNALEMELVS